MTEREDELAKQLRVFIASMKWDDGTDEAAKAIVVGNLNGFVGHLRRSGYAEIFEKAVECAERYDGPTSLVTVIEKYKPAATTAAT